MARVDFDSERHRVKLVEDTGESRLFENRDGVPCPVCGDPFDEALESQRRTEQLTPGDGLSLCLLREESNLVIYTHADDS